MRTFRKHKFDYVVVNKELDTAVKQVLAIVEAHHCRIDRIDPELIERIIG
jgi:guanylate kinase